jgi:hypothetical protein
MLACQVGYQMSVIGLSNNFDVSDAAQDHAKAGADEVLVVGQQNLDHDASRIGVPCSLMFVILAYARRRPR